MQQTLPGCSKAQCAGLQRHRFSHGSRAANLLRTPNSCRPARQGRQGPLITAQAAATAEAPAQVDEKSMQLAINAIRFLSIDAVDKANSGHPGLPMGCAPMAYVLFNEFINMDAKHPQWFNRDRFVLSAGHGSMLLYSVLHLLGYSSVTVSATYGLCHLQRQPSCHSVVRLPHADCALHCLLQIC